MAMFNYDEVANAHEFGDRPAAGGYVMKIVSAEDTPAKQYIKLILDYAEGEFKNYGENTKAATGWDIGYITYYLSYKPTMLGRLKTVLRILEEGNNGRFSGRKASANAMEFVNKGIGIVTQEEEYLNTKSEKKTRLKAAKFYLPNDIRQGNFKTLEKKLLDANAQVAQQTTSDYVPFSSPAAVNNDDLPF